MSKFYYNGVLLPEIPADVLADHPYCFIRKNTSGGYYDLAINKAPFYYTDSRFYTTDDTDHLWYRISISEAETATEWTFKEKTAGWWGINTSQALLWTNHTVPYGSETSTSIYAPKCYVCDPTADKLYYNGILLPSIPTEYFATHPFVWIRKNTSTGYYDLAMGKGFWYCSDGMNCKVSTNEQWYRIPINGSESYSEWVFNSTTSGSFGIDDARPILWSLQDVQAGVNLVAVHFNGTSAYGKNPEPPIPETKTKYLVRNNGTLYTVKEGALSAVSGDLSSSLFGTYGVDDIPDGALLVPLSNPEVLCWTDAEVLPVLKATVQGVPHGTHEIISDEAMIGHESVYGISSVEATASDDARFLLSFDGGLWMVYDSSNNEWSASDTGMTTAELVAIPENAWSSLVNSAQTMRLKAILDGVDTVTQVKFNFVNTPPV